MTPPAEQSQPIRIVMIGAGGLAASALWGLLKDWPKQIRLQVIVYDDDVIELSNLNRQIFFCPADLQQPKASVLASRLQERLEINDNTELFSQHLALTPDNVHHLLSPASFVLDTCDSTETKFLINDYCTARNIPFAYAGAVGLLGQTFIRNPLNSDKKGCLRCLFGDFTQEDYTVQSATCQQNGILGPIAGHTGFIQAQLVRDFVLSREEELPALGGSLLRFKFPDQKIKKSSVLAAADCPLGCGIESLKSLDLFGLKCPDTFLRTKLALEKIPIGSSLRVLFSSEDSLRNVSRSVVDEGHSIVFPATSLGAHAWQAIYRSEERVSMRASI